MTNAAANKYGVIALGLSLGGLVLPILMTLLAVAHGHSAAGPSYLIFLGFQIAAFGLGALVRKNPLGTTACIASAILTAGSMMTLG